MISNTMKIVGESSQLAPNGTTGRVTSEEDSSAKSSVSHFCHLCLHKSREEEN